MESIKIQGKEYVMVNERLKAFRADHPEYSLISEIVNLDNNSCIIKASILNDKGVVIATGHAQEDRDSTYINKTSFIENCETSAWGRALGNFGYGIDTSVASADEVAMAIAKQNLNDTREVIGGDYIFENGKHKGSPISMIPDDYLDWYLEKGYDEFIKKNIRKYREDLYKQDHEGLTEVTGGKSYGA